MVLALNVAGTMIVGAALAALIWSIRYPSHRTWPPTTYGRLTPIVVWVPTFLLFGILIVLGVLGWGTVAIPGWIRFGVGLPLIVISNLVVWNAVGRFGWAQTGGAEGTLMTDGLYRYSRNPQYVADVAMITGWLLMSTSAVAVPLGLFSVVLLVVAPFAEEPWLAERYGSAYETYRKTVPRFVVL